MASRFQIGDKVVQVLSPAGNDPHFNLPANEYPILTVSYTTAADSIRFKELPNGLTYDAKRFTLVREPAPTHAEPNIAASAVYKLADNIKEEFPLYPILKDTNPKDALGVAKVPLSTVSATVLSEVGVAMLEGARKYGRHNYRVIGVRGSVYYDATMRHMMDWWEGTDVDPDSGLSHITKAITSLIVMRDAMIQNKFIDDRPPRAPEGWQQALNKKCVDIINKYPDAAQVYTQASEK